MEWVDTHCHLTFSPLADDAAGVLARARKRGVNRIVVPAYDAASWDRVAAVAAHPGVYGAFGIHPWVADRGLSDSALRQRLTGGAVAVGEIGLDFKTDVPRDVQAEVFKRQLRLAVSLGLPVLLHVRGAFEETLDILAEMHPRPPGVVHAFSRGPELAARFLALGYHIAFGGAVTRPRAARARNAAAAVPLDRLLLETDAPSIGLDGVPAEETEPAHIADIAVAVAAVRGVPVETVAASTTESAVRLFGGLNFTIG